MILNSENYLLFAAKCYKKRLCFSQEAFLHDLNSLEVKGDITRYQKSKEKRNIRLIINKLIIAGNLFGPDSVDLVLFKLTEEHLEFCKTIYSVLGVLDYPESQFTKEIKDVIDQKI